MGELPKSPSDIELDAFDLTERKQIDSSYMTDESSIAVELSEFFGGGKYLIVIT